MNNDDLAAARVTLQRIAHDVKTPLTSILGFTQLLLENETIADSTREYLQLIEMDARRLNEIILEGLEAIGTTDDDR